MALSALLLAATVLAAERGGTGAPPVQRAFNVPEDRAHPEARTIALHVVILPATKKATAPPLFFLAGGPGQAASALAEFLAESLAGVRGDRDIVLVDQRGTGGSNPLMCDLGESDDLFPPERIAACAQKLAPVADVRHYTTLDAVADLEDVRRGIGAETIDLFGGSYGTRLAFEYLRAHPAHTHAVVLMGVVPPQLRYSIDPALDTQASWEKVVALKPSLAALAEKAMAAMPRSAFGVQLRNMLHSTRVIEKLPEALADPAGFASAEREYRRMAGRELAVGMYLSVVCAEDVWRSTDREVAKATAGTIAGDYWHRQLAGACAVWPHAEPQRIVATPFRASAPALLISGGFDPITPPRMGALAAQMLTNSRHVILANASHSFEGDAGRCVNGMIVRFLLHPDPKKVDESCTAAIAPPQFK